jgi:hypothetical protein
MTQSGHRGRQCHLETQVEAVGHPSFFPWAVGPASPPDVEQQPDAALVPRLNVAAVDLLLQPSAAARFRAALPRCSTALVGFHH